MFIPIQLISSSVFFSPSMCVIAWLIGWLLSPPPQLEAIPESLKNMLLVMDTAGIFHSADSRTGYSDLWEITWERIDCFLPNLREELFKQTVIPQPGTASIKALFSLYSAFRLLTR